MNNFRMKINDFFVRELWEIDVSSLNRVRAFFIRSMRLLYIAVREFSTGQLNLRAMSLVYTTLLSLVPLIAVSFSVLKAFGVHNQIEPLLGNVLAPLGEKGAEITSKIIGFVGNIKVGVLGSVGLGLLMYTVISLIKKIEDSLNFIWKIKRSRSFARRFSDYMSVILIGPVLIFSAIGVGASVMSSTIVTTLLSIEIFGYAFYLLSRLIPYIFVCSAFTFLYIFLPNIKVRLSSALVGGILAGVMWTTLEWAFASFIVSSAKYTAIYSGLAILILFMIWLYLGWLILLVGAQVSFYHQYPEFLSFKKESLILSNRHKERLSFLIMFLIGFNYYYNKNPWTLNSLVEHLKLTVEPVHDIISILEKKGLILETVHDPTAFIPARDIETIKLNEILDLARAAGEDSYALEERSLAQPVVDTVLKRIEDVVGTSLGDETLKNLVLAARDNEPNKNPQEVL